MIPVVALCAGAGSGARAEDVGTTLDNAGSLLARAFTDTKDAPIGASQDAGSIILALRSSHDPDLLPMFLKLEKSSVPENRLYAMVAAAVLTKDSKRIDLPMLMGTKDISLMRSALTGLIDNNVISNEQLEKVLHDSSDATIKAVAVDTLDNRKALKDRDQIRQLMHVDNPIVRCNAAIELLKDGDPQDAAGALKELEELSGTHNLGQAAAEAMLLVRVQKENITGAGPWAADIAKDDQNDEGLRYTAVTTLLAIKQSEGPKILASMIQTQRDTIQQVKLGLISLEFGPQLKPGMLEPIAASHSELVSTIGKLSQQGASGADITPGLEKLIKQGHPIVLDWALAYSDRAEPERRIRLLAAVIAQATIVDDARGRDYVRAVSAAEKLMDMEGDQGRPMVTLLLKSNNRAVLEAVLAGVYRSTAKDQSTLVLPLWESLRKTKGEEPAANYGALILAREGHAEATNWLSGMVLGTTTPNAGFRALAGWYYAKLQGKQDVLIQRVDGV